MSLPNHTALHPKKRVNLMFQIAINLLSINRKIHHFHSPSTLPLLHHPHQHNTTSFPHSPKEILPLAARSHYGHFKVKRQDGKFGSVSTIPVTGSHDAKSSSAFGKTFRLNERKYGDLSFTQISVRSLFFG